MSLSRAVRPARAGTSGSNGILKARPGLLFTVLFAIALAAPATLAADHSTEVKAGALVRADNGDVAMPYAALPDVSVCYVDSDGSGHYNNEDSVILTFQSSCSGEAGANDVRLADWLGHPAGERIRTGTDRGMTLVGVTPEPRFHYFDKDGDNRLSPADAVYLRLFQSEDTRVRLSDVRVTANGDHAAGTRVDISDTDSGEVLTLLGTPKERIRHTDVLETGSFSNDDGLWLSADTSRHAAGRGDIRIYSPEPALAFGEALDKGAPEPQDSVRTVQRYLCMTDESGTGAYTPGDALYLSIVTQCTGGVQPGDLRLSNSTHGPAGSRVPEGDPDAGATFIVLPDARVGYVDNDADDRLSRGDLAVLRIDSPEDNALRVGDLLLTPTDRGPGTVLLQGDPLLGSTTNDLGRFEDLVVFKPSAGSTSLGKHDPLYLSPDTSTGQGLAPQAIRLFATTSLFFGGPAGPETGELLSKLTRSSGSACTTRLIGEEYSAGDPVYLRVDGVCPNQVTSGLLRLVPVQDHPAFSIVRADDSDIGMTLLVPEDEPRLRYYSVGQSDWGTTTRLYLSLIDPSADQINPGDVRLTPAGDDQPAGRAVTNTDNDRLVGSVQELGLLSDHTGYIDMDGNNRFGTLDRAYIVPTTDHEYVTPLSVRLHALPAAFVPLEVPEAPEPGEDDNADDDGVDPDPDPSPDDGAEDDGAQADSDAEEEDTPAPGLLILGVLLALLATVGRRRA